MESFPEWNKKGEKNMAYLGEEIKKLGFGLMRLPQKSEGVIDVKPDLHILIQHGLMQEVKMLSAKHW